MTSHNSVPSSIQARMRRPCMKNNAVVPMHEAAIGSSDCQPSASQTPQARLKATKHRPNAGRRPRSEASERSIDTAVLATAVACPSSAKCRM